MKKSATLDAFGKTAERLLLIDEWVKTYARIPESTLDTIRKEAGIETVTTTITEHIFQKGLLQGKAEGEAKGKLEGKLEGEVTGQLTMLENLYRFGVLTEAQFHEMEGPLRRKLAELTGSPERRPTTRKRSGKRTKAERDI